MRLWLDSANNSFYDITYKLKVLKNANSSYAQILIENMIQNKS